MLKPLLNPSYVLNLKMNSILCILGNKQSLSDSTKNQPVPKCPQFSDKTEHPTLTQNVRADSNYLGTIPDTVLDATQENIDQSTSNLGSHYASVIKYKPSCNSGVEESLSWVSYVPSFQDMVANNNWIDLQGNQLAYPNEQKDNNNLENNIFAGFCA